MYRTEEVDDHMEIACGGGGLVHEFDRALPRFHTRAMTAELIRIADTLLSYYAREWDTNDL